MPETFWNSTLEDLIRISESYENKLLREAENQRQLEFMILQTATAGMSGEKLYKKIKRPKDLYELPQDKKVIENKGTVYDYERAKDAYDRATKKK